jgi:hypothetical protein
VAVPTDPAAARLPVERATVGLGDGPSPATIFFCIVAYAHREPGPVTKDRNVPPRLARQGGEGGEGAVDVTEAREDRAARRERSDRAPRGEFRGRGRGAGGRGGAGGRLPRHEFDRHGNIEHA